MLTPRYGVLDLKYDDGSPAVLRHVDGTGFAYYPSGRKAVCISASGMDARGKARRFAAILHGDGQRSPVIGVFDEWGRGYADGQMGPGDNHAPKVNITDKEVICIDGSGRTTSTPTGPRVVSSTKADIALQLNPNISLQHRMGRTTISFASGNVKHSFIIGELQGDEIAGMPTNEKVSLADETMRQLGEVSQHTKFKDVLENLEALKKGLANPNLVPLDLQWNTESNLRKHIAAAHPPCPGQKRNWSIARVSGKCTEERLASTKPTVRTPRTVQPVSQLQLPELIEETSSSNALLVVICLATYAAEQSAYAKLIAERAHAELLRRQEKSVQDAQAPFRFVAIELSELTGFVSQFGVKEVPYCLMFQGGQNVFSKRLRGMKFQTLREAYMARPRVLLVENNPAQQLKLERNLRRNGFGSDLALDGSQGLRLASQRQTYGVLLVSAHIQAEQISAIYSSILRLESRALLLVLMQ